MTRIHSMILATTLAILPISAFAQTATAPAKTTPPSAQTTVVGPTTAAPAGISSTGVNKPAAMQTTDGKVAKPDVKTPVGGAKTEVHGSNPVRSHHAAIKHVGVTTAKS